MDGRLGCTFSRSRGRVVNHSFLKTGWLCRSQPQQPRALTLALTRQEGSYRRKKPDIKAKLYSLPSAKSKIAKLLLCLDFDRVLCQLYSLMPAHGTNPPPPSPCSFSIQAPSHPSNSWPRSGIGVNLNTWRDATSSHAHGYAANNLSRLLFARTSTPFPPGLQMQVNKPSTSRSRKRGKKKQ